MMKTKRYENRRDWLVLKYYCALKFVIKMETNTTKAILHSQNSFKIQEKNIVELET